jgi:hypothetical protein
VWQGWWPGFFGSDYSAHADEEWLDGLHVGQVRIIVDADIVIAHDLIDLGQERTSPPGHREPAAESPG